MSKLITKETELQSALEEYLDKVYSISNSNSTRNSYNVAITNQKNGFRKFIKEEYLCDEIQLALKCKSDEESIYKVLSKFVVTLRKAGLAPGSVRPWYYAARGYMIHLDVDVRYEKCKQLIKLPKVPRIRAEPLTKELIAKVLSVVSAKLRTIILFALSSGMRIGEMVELKISDIDFESNPTKIKVRAEVAEKNQDARETFITTEATNSLKTYLKKNWKWQEHEPNPKLDDVRFFGDASFVSRDVPKRDTHAASLGMMEHAITRQLDPYPELTKKSENGQRQIRWHAFRHFFYTTLTMQVNSTYAHALMGRHEYLDMYFDLSEKERRKRYSKAEPFLTINDATKIERDLDKINDKQLEYDDKLRRLDRYFRIIDKIPPEKLERLLLSN